MGTLDVLAAAVLAASVVCVLAALAIMLAGYKIAIKDQDKEFRAYLFFALVHGIREILLGAVLGLARGMMRSARRRR
jgi:hypothetical protein